MNRSTLIVAASLTTIPILLGGVVALLCVAAYSRSVVTQYAPATTAVTAEHLYQDFDANAVAATEKYSAYFCVRGTIDKIQTTPAGYPRIVLDAGRGSIWCVFPMVESDYVARRNAGESISIVGRMADKIAGVVTVDDCRIGEH